MSQIWVSNTRDCLSSRFLFSIYGLALIWLSRKVTTQAKANFLAKFNWRGKRWVRSIKSNWKQANPFLETWEKNVTCFYKFGAGGIASNDISQLMPQFLYHDASLAQTWALFERILLFGCISGHTWKVFLQSLVKQLFDTTADHVWTENMVRNPGIRTRQHFFSEPAFPINWWAKNH